LGGEDIFDASNFLGEVIEVVSQDYRCSTAGLDTDEVMQVFLLSTRIRRKNRDSNDTSFEACLRYREMRGSEKRKSNRPVRRS
jgi:hypothetical protein